MFHVKHCGWASCARLLPKPTEESRQTWHRNRLCSRMVWRVRSFAKPGAFGRRMNPVPAHFASSRSDPESLLSRRAVALAPAAPTQAPRAAIPCTTKIGQCALTADL